MTLLTDPRFTPLEIAARGGSADVYRARDETSGVIVALKVLRDGESEWGERFEREARVLEGMSHPAIIRFVAFGHTTDGRPYLVTEWVEGETLRQRLRAGPLSVEDSVGLVAWISSGLAQAHDAGLVHRDIKPANIIVPDAGVRSAKLIDFGLIRHRAAPRTFSGAMLGTAGYMSPEQVRDASGVDPSSDVFSLGCVLFECLTGVAPFKSDDIIGMLGKVLFDDTPRVADHAAGVPRWVSALVGRMMSKEQEQRPRDAGAVVELLGGSQDTGPEVGDGSTTSGITDRERRILSVILAGRESAEDDVDESTMISTLLPAGVLEEIALPFGGVVELLGRGLALISLRGTGGAADHAVHAARCALELRSHMPSAPIVLVTGRAEPGSPFAVGEMFDRGARLLRAWSRSVSQRGIRIDDVTQALIGPRFEMAHEDGGAVLLREVAARTARTTLLGRATACVGRERELAFLQGVWSECVNEPRSRFVIVWGPAGIGKSRLRRELLVRLRRGLPIAEVWLTEAELLRAGSPWAVLRGILSDASNVHEGESDPSRRRRVTARVARRSRMEHGLRPATFLAELVAPGGPDDTDAELRAARANPSLMADQVERAFLAFVRSECEARPVLIVIDDFQWADPPSRRLVSAAVEQNANAPLLVIAFSRSSAADEKAEQGWEHLELGGLSPAASKTLVRAVLPVIADPTAERMASIANGSPFFLEELIRTEASGRDMQESPSVVAIMQTRLEALPALQRRVLRAASVFGESFSLDGVEYVLGERTGVSLVLDELARGEWLAACENSRDWSFRHAIVRDAAHAMLTQEDSRLAHRLAAQYLEQRGERDGWLMANHLEAAGMGEAAARWLVRAASQAMEANDHERAATCCQKGLSLVGDPVTHAWLLVAEAEARRWQGEHPLAARAADEAVALLAPSDPHWPRALEESARAHARLGQSDTALDRSRRLVAHGRSSSPEARLAIRHCGVAMAIIALGDIESAMDLLSLAESAAEQLPVDPLLEAHLAHARAVLSMHGEVHYDRYAAALEQTIAASRVVGDDRTVCTPNVNLGFILLCMGALERSIERLEFAIQMGEPLGLLHVMAAARHNLGYAMALAGRMQEGLEVERRSVAEFNRSGDRRLEGVSLEYVARILSSMGRMQEAEKAAREAVAMMEAFPATKAAALATLAHILASTGRYHEAISIATDEGRHPTSRGVESDGTEALALATALHGLGRVQHARAVLSEHGEFMVSRAATIAEPEVRASYWARSPRAVDAAILAASLGMPWPPR